MGVCLWSPHTRGSLAVCLRLQGFMNTDTILPKKLVRNTGGLLGDFVTGR